MRIAISGASGFVGSRAMAMFAERKHEVIAFVRSDDPSPGSSAAGEARWNPATGDVDTVALSAVDAVVHLAGAGIANKRWSNARKQEIADSRGPATTRLCATLARLEHKPKVLVGASAVGIYGDRGDEELDESSTLGDGFLVDVARAWEDGTEAAAAAGIRVVNLRIGIVLEPSGGALKKMLLPFKLGVGGRLGSGKQWMSWIARDDLVEAILFAIEQPTLRGPVNGTAPNPVTNREFTKALGKALHRPTILPAPAFALRLVLGEMADALLLGGQQVLPKRLLEAGFEFRHVEIEPTLQALLE